MPEFNQVITLYKQKTAERHVIKNVFFVDTGALSLERLGTTDAGTIKVVIPNDSIGGLLIAEGDRICKGEIDEDYPDLTSMQRAQKSYLIMACSYNNFGNRPNVMVVGK